MYLGKGSDPLALGKMQEANADGFFWSFGGVLVTEDGYWPRWKLRIGKTEEPIVLGRVITDWIFIYSAWFSELVQF